MSMPSSAAGKSAMRWPVARLVIGLLLTAGLLTYAWARVIVFTGLAGKPPMAFVALCVVLIGTVMLLTADLARALANRTWSRWIGAVVILSWLVVNGVLIALFNGPITPAPLVLAAFVPGTVWVAWLAWLLYWPMRWAAKLTVLVFLLMLFAASQALLRVEGLTGDAHVDFAWRWQKSLASDELVSASLVGVDLAKTTPNDFNQYLGPDRLAYVSKTELAPSWKTQQPKLLWRQTLGAGWSAYAVVGDFAVTQEQRGPKECVVCYRVADGQVAWIHADETRFDSSLGGPGPRATPTIVDGRVYAVGATGLLNCIDGSTGKGIWKVDILADNQGLPISHGVCGSPLVAGDLVIVCPTGTEKASLVAYHRETGKRVWQQGGQQASYGSPLIAELDGVRQILIHASSSVAGHDIATGNKLWSFDWSNQEGISCTQPIANAGAPGQVFAASGYGTGSVLFKVHRSTDGAWTTEKIWESRQMKTKFTNAVLHEGFVYGLDDGILACIDIKDGKKKWKDGRYQHGQVLRAGNLLIVQAEDGNVVLVELTPERWRELGKIEALTGKTWNNVALAGKYLLVRNDHEAACYELP